MTTNSALPPCPLRRTPGLSAFYPLDEFYAARGLPLPAIGADARRADARAARSLLAHDSDMTSHPGEFFTAQAPLRRSGGAASSGRIFPRGRAATGRPGQRVEFGAIKIMLDLFPAEAQREILREQQPLGRILRDFGIPFSSRPGAYLRMASDDFISRALDLGRRAIASMAGATRCWTPGNGRWPKSWKSCRRNPARRMTPITKTIP